MTRVKNKVGVITGSANGLGKALAIVLFKNGYHLALIDIDLSGLEKLKAELKNENQKITIHKADISIEPDVIAVRHQILEQHSRIDILINNAAISNSQLFEQVNLGDYRHLIDINFWGTVYCTKYFLPDLKKQLNSRLVNILSYFAIAGFPGKTTYASSKGAVMAFTNSLKMELTDTTLKVCIVLPPPMDTGLVGNSKHIDAAKKEKEIAFVKQKGASVGKVAYKIINQVEKGKYRIVISPAIFWTDILARLFPTAFHYLLGKFKNRIVDFI